MAEKDKLTPLEIIWDYIRYSPIALKAWWDSL
jgi:hypothetical protein